MFRLAHNETIDLGYSAYILVNKKFISDKESKELSPNSSIIINAVEELENEMSIARYKQLKVLINKYTLHAYIIRISCNQPSWTEHELVEHVRTIGEQQFFEDYCDYVIGSEKDYSDENIKERIRICTDNNSNKEVPSFTTYKYFKNHIAEIKDELIEFLQYYVPLYLKVKEEGITVAKESLLIYKEAFPDLEAFIDKLNFINKDIFTEDINLCGYVSAFMSTGMYIFSVSGESYFVIGSSLTYLLSTEYQIQKETLLFKCLAEPTKRKILSLLRDQELCSGDLVHLLELSKSTVSHHMSQLLSANLIYLSLKSGKKMYYSVNVTFMDETFSTVLNSYKSK